jgi:carbon-monoxide dehydrogenase large subunit
MTDGLSSLYQDLLGGSYDCVDRIVLNAYFRTGHDPGGFRVWWRALTGSDETLEIDDVGRCINPLIVHGQTHGGAAQGVGQAMWEECAIDPASGQPLCGSFMDYGMPRSDNLPSFATEIVEVLSPTNPFGIKAGGEGGCTPALAVVVSAVLDALAPLGVRDITMPTTPFKVWQAIRDSR